MLDEYIAMLKTNTWDLVPRPPGAHVIRSMWLFRHKFHADGSLQCHKARLVANGQDTAYLLLYVDDIILTASTDVLLTRFIDMMKREFCMTDLGSLHHFLGITATRSSSGLFLSQSLYTKDIISRASMTSCNPVATPVDTNSKLSATSGPSLKDPTLYRSLAGALQYLTFTRPDISYAVQQVCLFMHDPREPHMQALRRILRYLQGTINHGLFLSVSTISGIHAYSDADWAGYPDSRRSTSGFCIFLGDNLVSWSSKRQATVSRSSAEAEYRGVANAVAETTWLRNLLLELHIPLRRATIVYCDNVSVVYMSGDHVQHQRTKHVEIDIHFVRESVRIGDIRVLHIPSENQYVDIFTKGLPRQLFIRFRTSLSVNGDGRGEEMQRKEEADNGDEVGYMVDGKHEMQVVKY
ncbi:uncharacterized protein LOC113294458 [Papaver somniferum]|uniref:uncharacterized protein LOC113294458 n=1 Tax=Papaver somniferum TaxID=3469 RepID=UPI000E6FB473|nr:uncharacterized protein LOC113294458 [Papaver somniferum]